MASSPVDAATVSIDSPAVLRAGRELLSLALIDSRNHTLNLLAQLQKVLGPRLEAAPEPGSVPPLWIAGHIAWLAEYWIARNPQRALGSQCARDATRLASIEPQADHWFDPTLLTRAERWGADLPAADALRAYMLDTLETTLELLEKADDTDAGLYFFRMALWHEDLRGEELVVLAQTLGVPLTLNLPAGSPPRDAIGLPSVTCTMGTTEAGFAPAIERGQERITVPEFEIDSQPVSWAQYVEFIDDGGYDREELWTTAGWQWLQRHAALEGRRGPRHVEQIGVASGAVLQSLFGKPVRMGALQSAMHVSWWEADAYARWAGRRLATEIEWEIAAVFAARRGFRWGDVNEWTGGTIRPWQGFVPDAWSASAELDPQPLFGQARVQRGASFAARARSKHPKARRWALPHEDESFAGFRTCAI